MHGEKNDSTRIMKNLDQDRDFLDLLAAWHENKSLSPARKKALIARLEHDQDLRTELAREIEMAGLTRVAQAAIMSKLSPNAAATPITGRK